MIKNPPLDKSSEIFTPGFFEKVKSSFWRKPAAGEKNQDLFRVYKGKPSKNDQKWVKKWKIIHIFFEKVKTIYENFGPTRRLGVTLTLHF